MGAPVNWAGQTFDPVVSLDIATLEGAILAQLKSAASQSGNVLAKMRLEHFPDRPEQYRLVNAAGAVLMRYHGSTFGELMATDIIAQEETLEFEITIIARDLGWAYGGPASGPSPGAYALIMAVRQALTGFRIQGCTKMWPVRSEYVRRDSGVWYYAIDFRFRTMSVEASTTETAPELAEGIALETGGLTTVEVGAAPYTFGGAAPGTITLPYGNLSNVTVTSDPTGTTYTLGTDYSVDVANGTIARIASGAIPQGATVLVAYSYAERVIALASGGRAPTDPTN